MLQRLQKKWKVGGWRLLLILVTFALGGSATGWIARRIMSYSGIENRAIYILFYILLIMLLWPLMVILVSLVTGQFSFFKAYLARMCARMTGKTNK